MCRVKWCDKVDRFWPKNGKPKSLCSIHIQYKEICSNATSSKREYLMYKVEKWVKGEHQCEGEEDGKKCGFDPKLAFPSLHTKGQSSTLEVHHINSDKKGIDQYENPKNYSLLCKNCHTVEGHKNGDFVRKDYRN